MSLLHHNSYWIIGKFSCLINCFYLFFRRGFLAFVCYIVCLFCFFYSCNCLCIHYQIPSRPELNFNISYIYHLGSLVFFSWNISVVCVLLSKTVMYTCEWINTLSSVVPVCQFIMSSFSHFSPWEVLVFLFCFLI